MEKKTSSISKGWKELNEKLMKCTDVKKLEQMLEDEKSGAARRNYLLRIHSRINKVRAEAERAELNRKAS